jgi:hypothetical protein
MFSNKERPLLGSGAVNPFPQQLINTQQWGYIRSCFLWGPCRGYTRSVHIASDLFVSRIVIGCERQNSAGCGSSFWCACVIFCNLVEWDSRCSAASVTCPRRIFNLCPVTERVEQRYCNKCCLKLGDTKIKTIPMFQKAFGNDAMGVTQI